ncbi:MAG: DUF922 domain-containing protein [Elusimicrobiota bacterium]
MKCPKCGYENNETSEYCNLCYEVLKIREDSDANSKTANESLRMIPQNKKKLFSLRNILIMLAISMAVYLVVDRYSNLTERLINSLQGKQNQNNIDILEGKKQRISVEDSNLFKGIPPNTTYTFYIVTGKTYKEVKEKITNFNTGIGAGTKQRAWGTCSYEYSWNADYGRQAGFLCYINIKVSVTNTVKFPVWLDPDFNDKKAMDMWWNIMVQVRDHEFTHAKIANDGVEELRNALQALRANDEWELREKADLVLYKFSNEINRRQKEFDRVFRDKKQLEAFLKRTLKS